MSYATIQWQQSGGIGRITLNRPETLNAWTTEFGAELRQAVNEDAADPSVRQSWYPGGPAALVWK